LGSVAVARLDWGQLSRVAVRQLFGPPAFRTASVKSFCVGLAIFRHRFSFSSSFWAKVLSLRSSSSLLALASLPEFRSVSETLRIRPPLFFWLSLSVSVTAKASAFSSSCAVTFSVWVWGSAFRPAMANSRPEPSEFASASPHRFVALEGRGRQLPR
jgi:hypothetical protein